MNDILRYLISILQVMNNQQVDKIINFFRINHNFHDPYQILLDGNFIKLLVEKDIDLKSKLALVTKGKSTLRVTSCILRQLELLGEDFRLVLEKARTFKEIFCKHDLEKYVDQCILEQIGNDNQRQFTVCSQDIDLRRKLRDIENVPIMYFGPDQRITMEDIHKKTLQQLQYEMRNKFLPHERQMKEVEVYKQQKVAFEKKMKIKALSSERGIQIKTKIARGPNPLSIKKKQIKGVEHNPPQQESKQKRKRIRKRNKKGGQQPQSS